MEDRYIGNGYGIIMGIFDPDGPAGDFGMEIASQIGRCAHCNRLATHCCVEFIQGGGLVLSPRCADHTGPEMCSSHCGEGPVLER